MKATLKYYVSNNVNLTLLDNMSLNEIDEYTSNNYSDKEELMSSNKFSNDIYNFKHAYMSYIRKVKSNNPDYEKILVMVMDDHGNEYQLPVRYKENKRICNPKSLKNKVMKTLEEDNTCHAIYDVITKFGFLFNTDFNRINNQYVSSCRKICTYVKEGMGTSKYVEEGRKGTLKSISNELSKDSSNIYDYLRIIDSVLDKKYAKKKVANNVRVANNFSTYTDTSLKKAPTTNFVAEDLDFCDDTVNFIGGNDFGFEEESDLEEDDVSYGR